MRENDLFGGVARRSKQNGPPEGGPLQQPENWSSL